MNILGRSLILFGVLLIIAGVFFTVGGRIPWFGRLPGDIMVKKENLSFYFPITTCILISIIISLVLFLSARK